MTDMELVRSLRKVADSSHFHVTVFNPYFPFFDQFLQVSSSTYKCLTVSTLIVLMVTFILIPNAKAGIVLMLTIASIICQVCGFMVLWNVYLDVISMICLIMCIGFSVGMFFTETLELCTIFYKLVLVGFLHPNYLSPNWHLNCSNVLYHFVSKIVLTFH